MIFQRRLVVFLASLACAECMKSYACYQVYRFTPTTENHVKMLVQLERANVDFWRGPTQIGHYSDIMFSPDQLKTHLSGLIDSGMKNEELSSDVSKTLDVAKAVKPKVAGEIGWSDYYRIEDLHAFLDKMEAEHPDYAKVITYGRSFECRDLKLLKISKPRSEGGCEKPIIFVEPTIHAREWITTSVATYIINEVLNGALKSRLDDFDFYVVMVVNPDGYEYTHTDDRMWRKTRRPNGGRFPLCEGTDGNRNFDFEWKIDEDVFSTCEETYPGPEPFSEFETYYLTEYYKTIGNRVRFYLSLHSFGEYILCPWGYTKEKYPDYDRFKEVCVKARDAMKPLNGNEFKCGGVTELLYFAYGNSIDWAYGNNPDTTFVMTIELRGGTGGYFQGFMLPPEQILSVCQEFMVGFNIFLDHVPKT